MKIESDTAPRVVQPPRSLVSAFKDSKPLKVAWDLLSHIRKKEYAASINDAKHEATRQRRLDSVISALYKSRQE